MRWRLVASLVPLGLLVGVLSLFGIWPPWFEFLIWLVVGFVWIAALHFRAPGHPFRHGFTTGFLGGMLAVGTQAAFAATYLSNNQSAAESFGGDPVHPSWAVRGVILGSGLVITAVYGLLVGVFTRLAGGWNSKPRSPATGE